MKHICAALIAVLTISLSLAGQVSVPKTTAETESPGMPPGFFNTTVGVLIGTYKSADSCFNEVFGDKRTLRYGVGLSRTLLYYKGLQLESSFEARALSKTGKATLSGDETKLSVIPLTLTGRLQYQTKCVIPFIGGGADWYNYKEESVIANTSGWASGYHVQAGVLFVVPGADFLRVKLFNNYTKVTATANEIAVNLGGPEYGIGLSFGFNILNKAAGMVR